jgi:acetylornithine/succinyldiaminopimelate/putrescine aminotransferase
MLILLRLITKKTYRKSPQKQLELLLESIQGGAGFIQPQNDFLKKVRATLYRSWRYHVNHR